MKVALRCKVSLVTEASRGIGRTMPRIWDAARPTSSSTTTRRSATMLTKSCGASKQSAAQQSPHRYDHHGEYRRNGLALVAGLSRRHDLDLYVPRSRCYPVDGDRHATWTAAGLLEHFGPRARTGVPARPD